MLGVINFMWSRSVCQTRLGGFCLPPLLVRVSLGYLFLLCCDHLWNVFLHYRYLYHSRRRRRSSPEVVVVSVVVVVRSVLASLRWRAVAAMPRRSRTPLRRHFRLGPTERRFHIIIQYSEHHYCRQALRALRRADWKGKCLRVASPAEAVWRLDAWRTRKAEELTVEGEGGDSP